MTLVTGNHRLPPQVLPGCGPVLRAVSTPEEGKTCAHRRRFFLRLFPQEVAKNTRRGKDFPLCDGR